MRSHPRVHFVQANRAMRRSILSTALFLVLAFPEVAGAKTFAMVHGRNKDKPTATEACEYWGTCSCSAGTNSGGYSNSGWCGFPGGSGTTSTNPRVVIRYNASLSWGADWAVTDPICEVAAQINAINDTSVRVVGHSAGGLVTTALLTDAANGWGAGCGAGVVASAVNKITYAGTVASPVSGTKIADAVYGHLNSSGGGIISDWLHNLCGNTIGGLANIFMDESNDMTFMLQTAEALNHRSWLDQTSGKPVINNWGTTRDGDDSFWLSAGATCVGMETQNDGLVSAYSARGCTNVTQAGETCYGKPVGWVDEEWANIGHSSNRRGTSATVYTSVGHSHGMADLVWNHTPI